MARGWKEKEWAPSVLVLHEHHGTLYMDASTEAMLHISALKVLRGRTQSSDWYILDEDQEFRLEAAKFIKRSDGESAWELLKSRNHCADERVEVVHLLTSYIED